MMEKYYLIFVVILFALAISDLIVGVSNDAVNFLNSSIGSKAAPFRVIMIVAALGILVGATFSTGMMEVARKGIFHPDQFYFSEIMVLFLAVMMTDIILLDVFNTYGLPTSTTVSIVFELLGAALAISIIKIVSSGGDAGSLADYINTSKALAIIFGILISIVFAFSIGAVIQYLTRIIFSFNYTKSFKFLGAIWGGFAITAITYFILIKGIKGSSFATFEMANGEILKDWILHKSFAILGLSLLGWTIILQILMSLFRVNILKIIVLVGTFALAMAFAGNDLVNFIGVPLAGFESFKTFLASSNEPGELVMSALKEPVQTPIIFLLIAGLVMVGTLWTSKKARSVTATELNLARQDEGAERFESTFLARAFVRQFISIGNGIRYVVPQRGINWVNSRFDRDSYDQMKQEKGVSFDLIRASVNLVVASILIAIGTSFKLPLSTTYVTFMVAMGTSLADRAWGRESAVYRISGVITVVTGWFFTALIAVTVSAIIAFLIYFGGMVVIVILVLLIVFFIYRTQIIHKSRESNKQTKDEIQNVSEPLGLRNISASSKSNILSVLEKVIRNYNKAIESIVEENRKKIKNVNKEIINLNKETKELKDNLHLTIHRMEEGSIEGGHYYVQVLDYLRETAHCCTFIASPIFKHIDNNHPPFTKDQVESVLSLKEDITRLLYNISEVIKTDNYSTIEEILELQADILETTKTGRKKLIKSLKKEALSTKGSMLYLEILNESKNLVLYVINLLKSQRDFVQFQNENDPGYSSDH